MFFVYLFVRILANGRTSLYPHSCENKIIKSFNFCLSRFSNSFSLKKNKFLILSFFLLLLLTFISLAILAVEIVAHLIEQYFLLSEGNVLNLFPHFGQVLCILSTLSPSNLKAQFLADSLIFDFQ
jgi:hypothetical protein